MISISEKQNCCGCTACMSTCPKQCIQMEADTEGFLYPVVEVNNCVNCGACERVCPIQNPVEEVAREQKAYLVQHIDNAIRLDSTSGGAFTAIGTIILRKGGVVFGAAFTEKFQVNHSYVEKEEELKKFRNSKYVQSNMGNCFQKAKNFLEHDRWVCFSGTPCQIEGLTRYLGKQYEKLILIDVVCRGVPSPAIWSKYLEFQHIEEKGITNIRFRDKYYGYKYSTMSLIRDGNCVYHAGSQLDPMLRSFFAGTCIRPSCYQCRFKKRYRVSDMTIWECFSVYDFDKAMDDDKGTTRVLCHTSKGAEIVQEAAAIAKCREVPADKSVYGTKEMFRSVSMNPIRGQFMRDAQMLSGPELFKKYYPITYSVGIKTAIRKVLMVTGAYGLVRRYWHKIRGR